MKKEKNKQGNNAVKTENRHQEAACPEAMTEGGTCGNPSDDPKHGYSVDAGKSKTDFPSAN